MGEFDIPLMLSTPQEHGQRVKDAQYLLAGNNAFKESFHPGPVDGVMGIQVAGAIWRAKWYLGYPKSEVDKAMGQTLYEYLTGKQKLNAAMLTVRKSRLAAAAKVNTGKAKACEQARTDARAGVHESPAGSNKTKYGVWYGYNGVRWCCIAITYWLVVIGKNVNWKAGSFTASAWEVIDAARHGGHHLALLTDITKAEKGDLVIYENGQHIEFFIEWINKGVSFRAVGGNTSSSGGSYNNGGEVGENVRYVRGSFPATQFVRVGV